MLLESLEAHQFRNLSGEVFWRSEEHTSELQSQSNLVCRLLLEKKKRHGTGRSDDDDRRSQILTLLAPPAARRSTRRPSRRMRSLGRRSSSQVRLTRNTDYSGP